MAEEGKRVLYLGADTAYYKVLMSEFQRLYPGVAFSALEEKTPERIQGLILKVMAAAPALVFVDFSEHTEDYVHMARLLIRTNHGQSFPVIGLHDYLAPPEQIKESFLSGVTLNHIKSGEVFDVVFDAMALITPGQAKEHGFATAKLTQEMTASHLCKIGFVGDKGLHFETNLALEKNQELRIKHHWMQKKLVPSSLVKVKKTSRSLLFYHFKLAVDVQFAWLDPLVIAEGDNPQRVEELKKEYDHAANKARKAMETWVSDNTNRSQQKNVRILVIDRELSFYHNLPRTDSYGYALRCQPCLVDVKGELDAQRPQVIALVCDVASQENAVATSSANDMASLQSMIGVLKQLMPYELPYIVLFNATGSSQELQRSMQYPQLIAYDGPFAPDVLLKMASMFASKLALQQEKLQTEASAPRVFIKKSNPMSIGEIEETIELVQISESDGVFTCQRPLEPGSTLRIESPVAGYITVAPHPQLNKPPAYYFLINGIGESEKKALRRFVNALFFKDHDAAKLAELENFQNLNQAKWQEILEKQKAQLEAEEKARLEEAEKAKAEEKAAAVTADDKESGS